MDSYMYIKVTMMVMFALVNDKFAIRSQSVWDYEISG